MVYAIVIALILLSVYISRKLGEKDAEIGQEKTASEANRKAAEKAQDSVLRIDAQIREQERKEEAETYEHENELTRTRIGFYPRMHPDTDKDDLN